MKKRIRGHKATLLAAIMEQVGAIDEHIKPFIDKRQALASAIHAEAEEALGVGLPTGYRAMVDGDEIVIEWDEGDLPI